MPIEHVFVLMLENRSFDHMFGLSGLTGTDAVTGRPTQINGLSGVHTNSWQGVSCTASPPPLDPMKIDPAHEFGDVLEQLCGHGVRYPRGGPYPAITNSGYVSNFVEEAQKNVVRAARRYCDAMQCFAAPGAPKVTPQIPILTALAKEFAVCDSWYSSMPGPTWPNRFFAVAASSGGLDRSPHADETASWQIGDGFRIQNGTVFDAMPKSNWRIYAGFKLFAFVHGLKGIHLSDVRRYAHFASDLQDPNYPAQFTWIEPNYGDVFINFKHGNSQHPLDGVKPGEHLIRSTYEAIRNSPVWDTSMLVITWDEHGGFYDHAIPPQATPPGDVPVMPNVNESDFVFDQYGPRVPAVVISPLIRKNVIDHRPYDHASIPATVEQQFGLSPLTKRDAGALGLGSLVSLSAPRYVADILEGIPAAEAALEEALLDGLDRPLPDLEPEEHKLSAVGGVPARNEPIEADHNLPGFLYLAARVDEQLRAPRALRLFHSGMVYLRTRRIRTRGQARDYFEDVRARLATAEAAAALTR